MGCDKVLGRTTFVNRQQSSPTAQFSEYAKPSPIKKMFKSLHSEMAFASSVGIVGYKATQVEEFIKSSTQTGIDYREISSSDILENEKLSKRILRSTKGFFIGVNMMDRLDYENTIKLVKTINESKGKTSNIILLLMVENIESYFRTYMSIVMTGGSSPSLGSSSGDYSKPSTSSCSAASIVMINEVKQLMDDLDNSTICFCWCYPHADGGIGFSASLRQMELMIFSMEAGEKKKKSSGGLFKKKPKKIILLGAGENGKCKLLN